MSPWMWEPSVSSCWCLSARQAVARVSKPIAPRATVHSASRAAGRRRERVDRAWVIDRYQRILPPFLRTARPASSHTMLVPPTRDALPSREPLSNCFPPDRPSRTVSCWDWWIWNLSTDGQSLANDLYSCLDTNPWPSDCPQFSADAADQCPPPSSTIAGSGGSSGVGGSAAGAPGSAPAPHGHTGCSGNSDCGECQRCVTASGTGSRLICTTDGFRPLARSVEHRGHL